MAACPTTLPVPNKPVGKVDKLLPLKLEIDEQVFTSQEPVPVARNVIEDILQLKKVLAFIKPAAWLVFAASKLKVVKSELFWKQPALIFLTQGEFVASIVKDVKLLFSNV